MEHNSSMNSGQESASSDDRPASEPITAAHIENENKITVTIRQTPKGQICHDDIVRVIEKINSSYWIDMDAIQKNLEACSVGAPFVAAYAKDGEFRLSLEKNGMEASVILQKAYGGRQVTADDIKASLDKAGITYGVNSGTITNAILDQAYDLPVIIARGKEPVHGTDARVEYTFPTEFKVEPKLLDHDKIDYKDLQMIHSVEKGDILARKIPPTQGEAGFTITGRSLPAKTGKDMRLAAGRNSSVSQDGLTIISEIDGQPLLKGNTVFVEPVLVVQGDVNYATGNINFKGSVKILGGVFTGFSVKASESIEIEGVVEDCRIEAGRDINIKGGVLGANEGKIIAGQDTSLLFVENCYIEAGRNVYVGNALNSEISAGDTIDAIIGNGRIFGGKLSARNLITANILTVGATEKTQIIVGFEPKTTAKLKNLKETLAKTEYTFAEIQKHIKTLTELQQAGTLPDDKKILLPRLVVTEVELEHSIEELTGEISMLEATMSRSAQPTVKVRKTCHPNVQIRIGRLLFECTEEYHSAVFYEENNQIKVNVYESFGT